MRSAPAASLQEYEDSELRDHDEQEPEAERQQQQQQQRPRRPASAHSFLEQSYQQAWPRPLPTFDTLTSQCFRSRCLCKLPLPKMLLRRKCISTIIIWAGALAVMTVSNACHRSCTRIPCTANKRLSYSPLAQQVPAWHTPYDWTDRHSA